MAQIVEIKADVRFAKSFSSLTKLTGCTVAMETRSKKVNDNSKLSKVIKKKPPRVIANG